MKKRIKENKDHYFVADTYPAHHHRSPLQESYRRQGSTNRNGAPITIHDTPPIAHAFDHHQSQSSTQHQSSKPIPEVITISDSDDEAENQQISKSAKKAHNTSSGASTTIVSSTSASIKQSTPNINGNITSACPSVMPLTPLLSLARERGQDECYTIQGASSQSTPNCTSRSGVPSCVTVNGDSDEDFQAQQHASSQQQRAPIKHD